MDREHRIRSVEDLERLYGAPGSTSLVKESHCITPEYRAWVEAAPFAVLASAGAGGLDCSPRGDAADLIRVLDEKTLLLPDRRGNNRIDTLRNIVQDPRVALIFLVPGINESIRINGRAEISTEPELLASFAVDGKLPRSVLIVTVDSVYFQCARAALRAQLWDPATHVDRSSLPSLGQILENISGGNFDGHSYDQGLPERLKQTIY